MTTTLVHDPALPNLFNGQLTVHSMCRTCGEALLVTNPDQLWHPTCDPAPTYLETLATGWLSAIKAGDDEAAELTAKHIEQLEAEPPDLAGAAVAYAQDGWAVFPLAEQSHRPVIKSAHPDGDPLKGRCKGQCGKAGHGFHDATTDTERIARWWAKHPRHNIGLATGRLFDVIDVDPKNNGIPAFLELLQSGRLPDAHGLAVTRSGGLHIYVLPKGGRCRPGIRAGIDYKARGGYVIGPPSTMGRGRSYSWITPPSPMIKGGNK